MKKSSSLGCVPLGRVVSRALGIGPFSPSEKDVFSSGMFSP